MDSKPERGQVGVVIMAAEPRPGECSASTGLAVGRGVLADTILLSWNCFESNDLTLGCGVGHGVAPGFWLREWSWCG